MSTLTTDEVDRLASEVISSGLAKVQIRLAEIEFTSSPPSRLSVDVSASIATAGNFERNNDGNLARIVLNVRYTLIATGLPYDEQAPEQPDEDQPDAAEAWRCEVEMQGQWLLSQPSDVTADHIRAFALRVGLMAIHPYARSHIQSLVAESGWSLFTMDVLTNVDSIFASPEDPNLLDLEGIEVAIDGEDSPS